MTSSARTATSSRSTSDDAAGLGLDVVLRVLFARVECGSGDKMVRCVVWPAAAAFESASKTRLARKSLRPLSTLVLTEDTSLGLHRAPRCSHRDAVAAEVQALSCLGVSARSLRLTATPLARWSYSRTPLFSWTSLACVDTYWWAGQSVLEQVDLQLPRRPKAL